MADADNFEVETLLMEIENKPCLWDRNYDGYRNKQERKVAWNEICSALFSEFENWSDQEKQSAGQKLASKWRNLRDYHVKVNRRNRSKSGSRKSSSYAGRLGFLSKLSGSNAADDDDSSTVVVKREKSPGSKKKEKKLIADLSRNKKSRQQQSVVNCGTKLPVEDDDEDVDGDDDDDESADEDDIAFFESLLPLLKPLSTDEKLDLRLDVIQLLKKTRQSHFVKNQPSGQSGVANTRRRGMKRQSPGKK